MSRRLNVLLFAFGSAGVNAIRSLRSAGHNLTACFTHPTTQSWHPSLQDECRRLNIPCSTDPTDAELAPGMSARPDVVLSVFYRRRIELPFLGLPTIGAFNVAASQLPRYRGHFPFRWAILNNESMWGVTVHQMTQNFCDGAVLHRKPLVIKPQENAYDLSRRLADAAATAAVEAVAKLAAGDDHLASVEPAGPQFFGPEIPFGGRIDWHQSAAKIDSFVRAMDFGRPVRDTYQHFTPPAAATIAGKPIGIYRAHFGGTMSSYPAGTVTRCDDQVWVQTGRGHLAIERVFADGQDHDAAEYFTAQGCVSGDMFDTTHTWSGAGSSVGDLSRAA
jgi:methionyl-tRNA formyltransferase